MGDTGVLGLPRGRGGNRKETWGKSNQGGGVRGVTGKGPWLKQLKNGGAWWPDEKKRRTGKI